MHTNRVFPCRIRGATDAFAFLSQHHAGEAQRGLLAIAASPPASLMGSGALPATHASTGPGGIASGNGAPARSPAQSSPPVFFAPHRGKPLRGFAAESFLGAEAAFARLRSAGAAAAAASATGASASPSAFAASLSLSPSPSPSPSPSSPAQVRETSESGRQGARQGEGEGQGAAGAGSGGGGTLAQRPSPSGSVNPAFRVVRVCVGKEWYRFPSHFFLPEARVLNAQVPLPLPLPRAAAPAAASPPSSTPVASAAAAPAATASPADGTADSKPSATSVRVVVPRLHIDFIQR